MNRKRKQKPGELSGAEGDGKAGGGSGIAGGLKPSAFKKSEMSFIFLGAGVLTVIVSFLFFMSSGDKEPSVPQDQSIVIQDMESRLQLIESRLERIIADMASPAASSNGPSVDAYQARVDRVEAAVTVKFESLTKRMTWIENRLAALSKKQDVLVASGGSNSAAESGTSPPPPAAPKPAEPKKKTAAAPEKKQAEEAVYVVKKGDTLYGISRKFGLTLKELRQLNNMKSSSKIYPGNKLRVFR